MKGVTLLKEINAKLVLMEVFLGVKDVRREPWIWDQNIEIKVTLNQGI